MGFDPIYIDPLTGDNINEAKGVFLLAHNEQVTYPEQNFKVSDKNKLYCKILSGSVIVDPWRTFKSDDSSIKVIHYGNSRK